MIAIVGGGLTGLTLAYELSRRGVAHRVLEASGRPGGVVRSARVEGHLLEWGPQRARRTAAIDELIGTLGIAEEVVTAPSDLPLYVYRAERLREVPYSPAAFFRTDLLSWPGKLRLLAEPLSAGADPGETVASLLSRKFGGEAYRNLLGPLYGGLYASDPADMVVGQSLAHALREFGIRRSLLAPLLRRRGRIDPPPAISFREGLQTLPDALYTANRANVSLRDPVRALRRNRAGWEVEHEGGRVAAERVVLSVAAPTAARLLAPVAPEAAQRIGSLRYNPLAVVHVHARTGLRGLGYQVSFEERLVTRGVTFNDSLFGRDGVYTVYLGGAKAPWVAERADAELAEIATREFRQVTGADAEVLSVAHERMPAWDRSWGALDGLSLPDGLLLAANWESRPGMPGRIAQARQLARRLAES